MDKLLTNSLTSSPVSKDGTSHPPTPIPTMTTVPILCNQSSPNATSRNRTTPEDLSMFFDTVQPDNQMARHLFQKGEQIFEQVWPLGNQSGNITVNGCDELGMDGTQETTGDLTIHC